jgi:hypothetical protein
VPVNLNKPEKWKADIAKSVDMYNVWFMKFAPRAFRETRIETTKDVEATLDSTENMSNVKPAILRKYPEVLPTLRMSTCPPLAVDRLIGLAGVSPGFVKTMELHKRLPPKMGTLAADRELKKIGAIIEKMADPDIFVWLRRTTPASEAEIHRAATIVADRLCGSVANPIIRNAQEKRQLTEIEIWLERRGYKRIPAGEGMHFNAMPPGTYSFRMNVPVKLEGGGKAVKIPVDAIIMPKKLPANQLPLLFEAKSAGDFTNPKSAGKKKL